MRRSFAEHHSGSQWPACTAELSFYIRQVRQNSAPSPSSLFRVLLHDLSRHQAIKEGFAARSKGRKVHF